MIDRNLIASQLKMRLINEAYAYKQELTSPLSGAIMAYQLLLEETVGIEARYIVETSLQIVIDDLETVGDTFNEITNNIHDMELTEDYHE